MEVTSRLKARMRVPMNCLSRSLLLPNVRCIVLKSKITLLNDMPSQRLSEVVYSEAYTTQSGTFYYMSPEIHLGYLCDTTSDLYSAGVVMYELLYGRKPYPMHMPKKDFKMLLRLATPVQFPRERTAMLSGNCMNLLRGLLSYDKRERTFGNEIAYHPFLDIDKMCSSLNHYNEGYKFLSRSVDLAKQRQYGLAYVDANQAILHFEIHCKSLIHDMALYSYLRCKLVEYDIFSEQIKLQLTNCNGSVRYLYMPLHTEKLRCMLSSSPALLAAYDLCLVGEMWINRNDRDIGIQKLKDGMEIMSIVLPKAPESEQKWLLLQKYTQWSRRLVKLKAMRKDALPVQSR